MLDLLRARERTAGALAEPFRISKPAVSQHLRILEESGLVSARQDGRQRIYRLTARPLKELCHWAESYTEIADPAGHVWRIHGPREGQVASASRWVSALRAAMSSDRPAAGQQRSRVSASSAPGEDHQKLVGDWELDGEYRLSPNPSWTTTSGHANTEAVLGGRFVLERAHLVFGSNRFEWIGLYGFDDSLEKYTAAWVNGSDSGMAIAEGVFDAARRTVIFATEQLPRGGGGAPFKWSITFESANRFRSEMRIEEADGNRLTHMRVVATRVDATGAKARRR